MQKMIQIKNHTIEKYHSPFIISEAGLNHNGELEKAFRMIEIAKESGSDAIKFQTYTATDFISEPNQTYTYHSQGNEITESMIDMFERCEFTTNEWFEIKKKCEEEKIIFLSTPVNPSDLEFLIKLDVPAVKIGSSDLTNLPLLKSCKDTGLPILLSCGMASTKEISESLKILGSPEKIPVVLLVCTSEYPTPTSDVNLLRFQTFSELFPDIPLGFSDHTQGTLASSLAIAMGSCVFEKHFTLDHNLPGPDHWFSEDPTGLKQWIESIRLSFKMMGSSMIKPTLAETKMKKIARKSIVALEDISKGEVLGKKIGVKRPGYGLSPTLISEITNKKSNKTIKKNSLLKLEDFE
tara:strand:+ start:3957 stop:5009 length:1053 start_codon:yes stop_codon:yes gene_type:complete